MPAERSRYSRQSKPRKQPAFSRAQRPGRQIGENPGGGKRMTKSRAEYGRVTSNARRSSLAAKDTPYGGAQLPYYSGLAQPRRDGESIVVSAAPRMIRYGNVWKGKRAKGGGPRYGYGPNNLPRPI